MLSFTSANLTPSDLTHGALRLSSLAAPLAAPLQSKSTRSGPRPCFHYPETVAKISAQAQAVCLLQTWQSFGVENFFFKSMF